MPHSGRAFDGPLLLCSVVATALPAVGISNPSSPAVYLYFLLYFLDMYVKAEITLEFKDSESITIGEARKLARSARAQIMTVSTISSRLHPRGVAWCRGGGL